MSPSTSTAQRSAPSSPSSAPPTDRRLLPLLRRAWAGAQADRVPLLAAGVAFYAFLALFPALIAAVTLYGLVRDPGDVQDQVARLSDALPADAASLLTSQLEALTATPSGTLGIGLVVSLLLALWSAAGGVGNIITAVCVAFDPDPAGDGDDGRGFVRRKALALGLTAGGVVLAVVLVGLVAVAPAVLDGVVGSGPLRWALEAARWLLVVAAMVGALTVLYRVAPGRRLSPGVRRASLGALLATLVWVLASVGFSLYVDNFGSYNKTYGAMAGVVVLLLWLWLTMLVVLLGAEVDAESERLDLPSLDDGDDGHDEDDSRSPARHDA